MTEGPMRQMSEKRAWAYIAQKIQRTEPLSGLCHEIVELRCRFPRPISSMMVSRMRNSLRATFDCGLGYYWPLTRKGHEERVIAAQLLSELAR